MFYMRFILKYSYSLCTIHILGISDMNIVFIVAFFPRVDTFIYLGG